MQAQTLSAKLVDISTLMSTMAETKMVLPELAPPSFPRWMLWALWTCHHLLHCMFAIMTSKMLRPMSLQRRWQTTPASPQISPRWWSRYYTRMEQGCGLRCHCWLNGGRYTWSVWAEHGGERRRACSGQWSCSHNQWVCGRAGIAYHQPWIEPNHEMVYLTDNPNSDCDLKNMIGGFEIKCCIIGRFFKTYACWIGHLFKPLVWQIWMSAIILTYDPNCLLKIWIYNVFTWGGRSPRTVR